MAGRAEARIYLIADDRGFRVGLNRAARQATAWATKVKALGASMTHLGESMTRYITLPIVGGLALATKAAIDEQKEMTLLSQALRVNAHATAQQVDQVERWITATQNATGIADDQLRPALANLVRATKDTGRAQQLLTAAMDISVGKGKSLEQVSMAIAKAYTGNVGALGRLGLAIKDAKGKTVDFDTAMRRAVRTFGGAAQAAAGTTAGKLAIAKAELRDVAESVGTRLIPVAVRLASVLGRLADWFSALSPRAQDTAIKVALFAAALGPILSIGGRLVRMFGSLVAGVRLFAGALAGTASISAGFSLAPVVAAFSAVTVAAGYAIAKAAEWRQALEDEQKRMVNERLGVYLRDIVRSYERDLEQAVGRIAAGRGVKAAQERIALILSSLTAARTQAAKVGADAVTRQIDTIAAHFRPFAAKLSDPIKQALATAAAQVQQFGEQVGRQKAVIKLTAEKRDLERQIAAARRDLRALGRLKPTPEIRARQDQLQRTVKQATDAIQRIDHMVAQAKVQVQDPTAAAQRARAAIAAVFLSPFRVLIDVIQRGGLSVTKHAEGGIVRRPQVALLGEAGPEAVVPLTRPRRAAEILAQSGLALGSAAGPTIVMQGPFIGAPPESWASFVRAHATEIVEAGLAEQVYSARRRSRGMVA